MAQEARASLTPKSVLKGQLIYRLNFAAILNTPEAEFAKLIAEIEKDDFVQKLLRPENSSFKILSKKRYPNTRLSSGFYEMDEGRLRASTGRVDIESLLAGHKGMTNLIQRIGRENFEKHFLYREGHETLEESAQACGISAQDARGIAGFLLDISIQSEFFHPSSLPAEGTLHYSPVARIEIEKNTPVVHYLSPNMASGRYMIDRDRLPALKKTLSRDEKIKLREVLSKIEWINLRQDTLQKAINAWGVRQDAYLRTGEPAAQMSYTQKDLAADLNLAPSTVSRCVFGKSVILPWGDEKPLKDLFFNNKQTAVLKIGEIIAKLSESERNNLSDARLSRILFEKYRVKASRRSVNLYRRDAEGRP